jgi:hypothetical protein
MEKCLAGLKSNGARKEKKEEEYGDGDLATPQRV